MSPATPHGLEGRASPSSGRGRMPPPTTSSKNTTRHVHHADPFDRMLVAQARVEGLTLVTHDPAIADPTIAPYDVHRLD